MYSIGYVSVNPRFSKSCALFVPAFPLEHGNDRLRLWDTQHCDRVRSDLDGDLSIYHLYFIKRQGHIAPKFVLSRLEVKGLGRKLGCLSFVVRGFQTAAAF